MPGFAVAILAVGCCLALVLDKLWLDAARSELRTAAQASVLAAAGRLADDDRINPLTPPEAIAQSAREAAWENARQNPVGGQPVSLDVSHGGRVLIGRHVMNSDTGEYRFLETDYLPTAVRVEASRSRAFGNPVVRLFSGLTGYSGGDAYCTCEAALSNVVVGVRPIVGSNVPAWPLAVYEYDPSGDRTDTWEAQIEQGLGQDQFRFNRETRSVEQGADGLPEIRLHLRAPGGEPSEANVQLVDLGTGLDDALCARQIHTGFSAVDLGSFGGELRLDDLPVSLDCQATIAAATSAALLQEIGQKRLLVLYSQYYPGQNDAGRLVAARLVAGRIMSVEFTPDGRPELIVQPAVVATRTAILGPPDPFGDEDGNSYVYKISLTN